MIPYDDKQLIAEEKTEFFHRFIRRGYTILEAWKRAKHMVGEKEE